MTSLFNRSCIWINPICNSSNAWWEAVRFSSIDCFSSSIVVWRSSRRCFNSSKAVSRVSSREECHSIIGEEVLSSRERDLRFLISLFHFDIRRLSSSRETCREDLSLVATCKPINRSKRSSDLFVTNFQLLFQVRHDVRLVRQSILQLIAVGTTHQFPFIGSFLVSKTIYFFSL